MVDNIPMKNICRVCLVENGEMISIFSLGKLGNTELQIADIIMACAAVQISEGDGLPSEICAACSREVNIINTFKQKCEKSDVFLRSRFEVSRLLLPENEYPVAELKEEIDIKPDIYPYSNHVDQDVSESENISPLNENESLNDDLNSDNDSDVPLNNISSSKVSKCPLCEKSLVKRYVNKHLKNHTNGKEFECEFCFKGFSKRESLIRHESLHSIDFTYKTEESRIKKVSGKRFKKKIQESRKKSKIYSCEICEQTFFKSNHLNYHMKTHEQVYSCEQCHKSFCTETQLTKHLNSHATVIKHSCNICNKAFKQISNLKSHLRTHNKEKPFLCSTCGKGFTQVGNLQEHMLRHTGIKAHICNVCGNGFVSKGELVSHSRTHSGIRPYICDICSADFPRPDSLRKHKEGVHLGKRPYECDVCKATFSRPHHLVRHKRTHTGEKPYTCKFCAKKFTQSKNLVEHIRIHTGEKPYVCDVCGKGFTQGSPLKTHKKIHMNKNSLS